MAFRLPQAAPQRHIPIHQRQEVSRPASLNKPLDQSQEWVLFSPTTDTYTPTVDTHRTAGVSRLSDFGSLNSAVPPSHELEQDDHDDFDSLDDGLHEFREPLRTPGSRQMDHSGGAILPGHDGLGSFHVPNESVQDQIWQHERFNPRRRQSVHQRLSSTLAARLDTIEDEHEPPHEFVEGEKLERIERWRLDQSRSMLEEVQKEAKRRRRLSLASQSQPQSQAQPATATVDTTTVIGNEVALIPKDTSPAAESETFWQHITRRVIKDFMGIDEALLSVILGESLPEDDELSTTPKAFDASSLSRHLENSGEDHLVEGWEDRLLRRLAKELNTIVSSLSDQQAAFSTYSKPEAYDYAGIPINPRSHPPIPESEVLELSRTPRPLEDRSTMFKPTMQQSNDETETTASEHEAGWGIEDSKVADEPEAAELEYWERTPDLKQVFAYLSHRFLKPDPQGPASMSEMTSTSHGIATHSTPASLRRAAIIRQHHPLVSRAHEATLAKERITPPHPRRASMRSAAERLERPAASECGRETISASLRSLKRVGDDCASQSTKRSKTSRSRQHYWEMGSDSAAAALGGMGAWGEV